MPYKIYFLIFLMSFLAACGRIEHFFNRAKLQLSSQNPSEIAVSVEESRHYLLEVHTLLTNLYLPWSITFLPDNSLLISEKDGGLYRFYVDSGKKQELRGLPASKLWGQGGLMDVVPHPEFANNKRLYFSYTKVVSRKLAATAVAYARLEGNELIDLRDLFVAEPALNSGAHFGSALVFDDQNRLYITSGERGNRPLVQKLDNHIGKIIRLNDDGTIPDDNPFIEVVGAKAEIYSYGHRNPQGMAVEPVSRQIWAVEHGPRGGDEVNHIRPGLNYGWPIISHGVEYDTGAPVGEGAFKKGMEQPLYFYVPSIATSGVHFYTGSIFPKWKNDLFIGALSQQHLNRLSFNGAGFEEERLLEGLGERIRDVTQGLDGYLYIITDSGKLLQVRPGRS